ncbi:MAG: chemotaxis protein CheB, partial [Acidobacteria bacterium]
IMQATVAPSNPFVQGRNAAIVEVAAFEAVNTIIGDYKPYLGTLTARPGASPDAAAIVAAHDTLLALYPANAFQIDTSEAASLAAIPDGQSKTDGIAVGAAAAIAILTHRANDGQMRLLITRQAPTLGTGVPHRLHL